MHHPRWVGDNRIDVLMIIAGDERVDGLFGKTPHLCLEMWETEQKSKTKNVNCICDKGWSLDPLVIEGINPPNGDSTAKEHTLYNH